MRHSLFKISKTPVAMGKRALSTWLADVPMGPADPILGLTERFKADSDPRKVSLGVGAYRDDQGKPYILPSVRDAEKRIYDEKVNKEYAGITGIPEFVDLSLKFAYGEDSQALKEGRVTGAESLSGTGALRVAGEFINRFHGAGTPIYVPNPTWGNHIPIFKDSGLEVRKYAYYKPETRGLDFDNLMNDVQTADNGSIFLLHACAHNPTGVDPSHEQWDQLSQVMKEKEHIPFFDCAYQGFASGNAEHDAYSIRKFVADGHKVILSQSYAKNFGLYGERIGCLSFVAEDADEAKRIESQVKILIRPMYSNPPIHGAHIVKTILSDDTLKSQWYDECKGMADRIIEMRTLLRTTLEAGNNGKTWNHITDQIGMFCYTGLTEEQVARLADEHHIYMTKDGRISMAGVNSKNVEYVANSIDEVCQSLP